MGYRVTEALSRQTTTDTFRDTSTANFKSPLNLTFMFLDCVRTPEDPVKPNRKIQKGTEFNKSHIY